MVKIVDLWSQVKHIKHRPVVKIVDLWSQVKHQQHRPVVKIVDLWWQAKHHKHRLVVKIVDLWSQVKTLNNIDQCLRLLTSDDKLNTTNIDQWSKIVWLVWWQSSTILTTGLCWWCLTSDQRFKHLTTSLCLWLLTSDQSSTP